MTTRITDLGYFRVDDERIAGVEVRFRDGELSIRIEGSGYHGDEGSITAISIEDARALLAYLQEALPK